LVDSENIQVRIRLIIPPGELVEITDADGGIQVPGTDWWSCATDSNGRIELMVRVGARETEVGSQTVLKIVAEEMAASGPPGTVAFGAVHETTIVPP
jgi:hypothetical protein